jgi:hypothetical protein
MKNLWRRVRDEIDQLIVETLRSRAIDRRAQVDKWGDTIWPDSTWPDEQLRWSKTLLT